MDNFINPKFRKHGSDDVKIICLVVFFGVQLLFAATTPAQNAAPQNAETGANAAPQASAPPAASPTAIPFSDVVSQAENASATLKEIAAGVASDPATDTIERNLPALTDEINARLEETAQTVEGSTSLDRLRTFEADWRTLTANLPDWKNNLTARARKLESDSRRLDELSERWQKTLDELRKPETPPEVLARVEEIIRTAAETRRTIVAEQARVVALQTRVAEQQTRAAEALKTIAARRQALVGQLLVQDNPPVWSSELWATADVRSGVRASLAAQLDGLYAFAARNKDQLAVHFLVFVLFAAALFYLRRRARPLVEANPELKPSAIIFYLPVSTALVLAILFSSRIYPPTPQILRALFGAAALVPTVIILRKLVGRTLYPLLYSLVAFFFVSTLR